MSAKGRVVSGALQNEVLLKSRRRCALCYALLGDSQPKLGQIARLSTSKGSQPSFENLVYLCLEHHERFDRGHFSSDTVASKRDELYKAIDSEVESNSEEIQRTVLVAHGHDMEKALLLIQFLKECGLEVIRFSEQPSFGRSMVEKFESANSVGCAVILLTAEEWGGSPEALRPRARQNLVFELGYLLGRLGRNRILVVAEPGIELPSDYHGLYHIELAEGGGWRLRLASELNSLGLEVKGTTVS